jgi:hypothetical protein
VNEIDTFVLDGLTDPVMRLRLAIVFERFWRAADRRGRKTGNSKKGRSTRTPGRNVGDPKGKR